jgi:hypothetical protein
MPRSSRCGVVSSEQCRKRSFSDGEASIAAFETETWFLLPLRSGSAVIEDSRVKTQLTGQVMIRLGVRLFCTIFGHRRSRRRAYVHPSERRWHSFCRRCGTPMYKDAINGWQEA